MKKKLNHAAKMALSALVALPGVSACGAVPEEHEEAEEIGTVALPALWSTDVSYERAGMPWKNSSAAGLTIRLHFVALADDNGSNAATVDPTFIRGLVEAANTTFASAKIQFAFDSSRDYETVNNTALNSLANGSGSWWTTPNAYAANFPGKLVVFLRKGQVNGFAYPPNTGAPVPDSSPLPTSDVNFVAWFGNRQHAQFWQFNLMHEIGHYLGLFHTHPTFGDPFNTAEHTQAIADGDRDYFDGDLLSDTPIDPGRDFVFDATQNDMCTNPFSFPVLTDSGSFMVFDPDYRNIMSYYHCPNETITPQQADLMRDTLNHATRVRLLKSRPPQRRLERLRPSDDGAAILLHDVDSGGMRIHLPNDGEYGAATFVVPHTFCAGAKQNLYRADFNGDGRTDLLCHDVVAGALRMDRASTADGSTQPYGGTDWSMIPGTPFCAGKAERLIVGRFSNDTRTDLMCVNVVSGARKLRYATSNGTFVLQNPTASEGWDTSDSWCIGDSQSLHIGDFNDDGQDDLLCHDVVSGKLYIDHASNSGQFLGTNWSRNAAFCKAPGVELLVGNVDEIMGDDLVCHNPTTGEIWEMYSDSSGTFENAVFDDNPWCKTNGARLYIGDADGNGREDLICFNESTRKLYVDYADSFGRFQGTDWNTSSGWSPLGPKDLK
ncbi:MAG TPA: hypothetical protein VIM73_19415 [Polyangiaceae bacterium]